MIKNIVQPFITDLIQPVTPSGSGSDFWGGGFNLQASAVTSSLIDFFVVSSGSANVYGTYLQGYGRGMYNYVYGGVSPNNNTFADGSTHNVYNAAQVNNRFQLTFGATNDAQYLTQDSTANTDEAAFKTVKLYNINGTHLVSYERSDLDFTWRTQYGYVNGSFTPIFFPQWMRPPYAAGESQYQYFVPQNGAGAQTVKIEFWS